MSSLQARLTAAQADLGLSLTQQQQAQLLQYLTLLQKWNKVYNLTAVRNAEDMLTLHLLDCLAVVPLFAVQMRELEGGVEASRLALLDVGSGGGLPGVVLAICFPQLQVTCVDAVAKKMAFVRQVAGHLDLSNLVATHARVEDLPGQYPLVSSRAFSSLRDFVQITGSQISQAGIWFAMKGRLPQAEMCDLPADVEVFHVEPVRVPGLNAERCVVLMRRCAKPE